MNHQLSDLCRALKVSASGYHAWRKRPPSQRAQDDTRLAVLIAATHRENREAYGSRRLVRALHERGIACGRYRMDRLRRQHDLLTRRRRRFIRARAANQRALPVPRHLEWPFVAAAPNRVWMGDITYIPTGEGPLYLAVIIDLYSRRVIGWAMDSHQRQELAERALRMALLQRPTGAELTLHHDRGSQYTSTRYRAIAEESLLRLSFSRSGMPYDNAVSESFFASLKFELPEQPAKTRDAARLMVFDYLEVFYNRIRMHSSLGYRSPLQTEQDYQLPKLVS
jgi:putative transposase